MNDFLQKHDDLSLFVKRQIVFSHKEDLARYISTFYALMQDATRDYPLLVKSSDLQNEIARRPKSEQRAIREYAIRKLNDMRQAFMRAIPPKEQSRYRNLDIQEITEQFAQAIQRLEQGEAIPTDKQLIHALHRASQVIWKGNAEIQALYASLSHRELMRRLTETIASIERATEPGDEARKEKITTDASLDVTRKTGNELVDAYRQAVASNDDALQQEIKTRFITEYRDMLVTFCKSLLRKYPMLKGEVGRGGFEHADDFFHEFLATGYETTGGRIHNLFLKFRGGKSSLEQYVRGALDNFVKNILHTITRETEIIPAEKHEEGEPSAIDLYPAATLSPEEETVRKVSSAERKKIIEEILSIHPAGEEEFKLYLKGYSITEIAEMLSKSKSTVQTYIYRIKTQIRELARERGMLD